MAKKKTYLTMFFIAMLFSHNFLSISNSIGNNHIELYTTIRDTIHLTDFSQFDLVVDNPHIRTEVSSSQIEIFRNDSETDASTQAIKFIYSLPSDFSCFEFDFQVQFDIDYPDLTHVGYLELHFTSLYNAAMYSMGSDTIGITSVLGRTTSIAYDLTFHTSVISAHAGEWIYTDIPKSIICRGNRTTRDMDLSIDRVGSSSNIITRFLDSINENKLKYVNLAYSVPSSSENFTATISNLDITLYSTKISTVFDSNSSSYSNTSKILGFIFPAFIGISLFLGVSVIIYRKKREW